MTYHQVVSERTLKEKLVRKYLWPELALAYTMELWDRRERLLRRFFPIRYFLFETVPTWYNDNIRTPIRRTQSWIRYRTIDRYHVLKLDRKPGYCDPDELLLYSTFQVLVDFVEIEMAAVGSHSDGLKRFKTEYRWRRRFNLRDGNLGIKAIQDMKVANPQYGPNYNMIIDLYEWWKYDRSLRLTMLEDEKNCLVSKVYGSNTPDYYKIMNKLDNFYYEEDSAMIAKLSSIRGRLWY